MRCAALKPGGNERCVLEEGHPHNHKLDAAVHRCHARHCDTPVKPEMLMCLKHWRMVPKAIQRRIWAEYRPGQCDDKNISEAWLSAADEAIAAVLTKEQR